MDIADRNTLLAEIEAVYRAKREGHVSWVCKKFNCSRAIAKRIITKLKAGEDIETELNEAKAPQQPVQTNSEVPAVPVEDDTNQDIVDMGGYTWNRATDTYIVPLRTYGREYNCSGAQHRALAAAYSRWTGPERTVEDLGITYNMTPEMVKEYIKITGIKREGIPVTKEELLEGKGEEAARRLLQARKLTFEQEMQKAEWKETQEDAKKWRALETAKINPFERALENFKPEPISPLPCTFNSDNKTQSNRVFVIGLTDLHIGGLANAEELVSGDDFNPDRIKEIIDDYMMQIAKDVAERTYKFEKVIITVIGDILHSLTGFTEKGTMLDADGRCMRETQFDLAMQCLMRFIQRAHEIFGNVEVQVVKGNHAGSSEYVLFRAIEGYFNNVPTVKFVLHKARAAIFRVLNTAVMLDHGDSDYVKAKVPKAPINREAYIQRRFLHDSKILNDTNSRIMIQGDMHHFEHNEYGDIEFFMFGSAVTGDRYADHCGFNSRPRQNCLIIDETGVKEVLHYFFD